MKRYAFVEGHPAEMVELQDGEYVSYEEVEPIVADRDIKAANLRLLVEKVLAYDTEADLLEDHEEGGGVDHVEIMTTYDRMVRLARGLK